MLHCYTLSPRIGGIRPYRKEAPRLARKISKVQSLCTLYLSGKLIGNGLATVKTISFCAEGLVLELRLNVLTFTRGYPRVLVRICMQIVSHS